MHSCITICQTQLLEEVSELKIKNNLLSEEISSLTAYKEYSEKHKQDLDALKQVHKNIEEEFYKVSVLEMLCFNAIHFIVLVYLEPCIS